jgi:hemin uptake protein HemP
MAAPERQAPPPPVSCPSTAATLPLDGDGPLLRLASEALFRGSRTVVIAHRGQEYRLHITRAGKLILTK